MKAYLEEIYNSHTQKAQRFRFALLVFDILMLVFLFGSSFFIGTMGLHVLDAIFAFIVIADIGARWWISRNNVKFIFSWHGAADILAAASLLVPLMGDNTAFLRVAAAMRLFRTYETLARLRIDYQFFRKYEDIIVSTVNLVLFICIMTALVYESQYMHNTKILSYIDALYFTVSTLTTTGFGDIVLVGDGGKLIAVAIMFFGVSLFIRLIQTVFRPAKVRFPCPDCALLLHDRDAVHCKHCGKTLNIPDEGLV